jgi:hypothetical protein
MNTVTDGLGPVVECHRDHPSERRLCTTRTALGYAAADPGEDVTGVGPPMR